jgi:hypothetical protein
MMRIATTNITGQRTTAIVDLTVHSHKLRIEREQLESPAGQRGGADLIKGIDSFLRWATYIVPPDQAE